MKLRNIILSLILGLILALPGVEQVSYSNVNSSANNKKDQTVYVTRTGSKYHLSGCRYLRQSKIAMKLSEACGSYTACSVCKPPKCSSK